MTIKSLTGTVISEGTLLVVIFKATLLQVDEKIGALQKKSCCACTVM